MLRQSVETMCLAQFTNVRHDVSYPECLPQQCVGTMCLAQFTNVETMCLAQIYYTS